MVERFGDGSDGSSGGTKNSSPFDALELLKQFRATVTNDSIVTNNELATQKKITGPILIDDAFELVGGGDDGGSSKKTKRKGFNPPFAPLSEEGSSTKISPKLESVVDLSGEFQGNYEFGGWKAVVKLFGLLNLVAGGSAFVCKNSMYPQAANWGAEKVKFLDTTKSNIYNPNLPPMQCFVTGGEPDIPLKRFINGKP